MRRSFLFVLAASAALLVLVGPADAARFDPLFRVVGIRGECMVQPAGQADFVPAIEDRAYHYGTKIKTGPDSAAIVRFSNGNDCRKHERIF